MEADISQSEQWLRFLAWLEDNWRRAAAIASVVLGIGIVVAFVMWQGVEKERLASEALSFLMVANQAPTGDALLGFADKHNGTMAGTRALLLAAGAYFAQGKYGEAQSQFERFLAEQPAGPLTAQARFGVAACKEAQGQIDGAIGGYKSIVENPASGNVIPQARFALGRLYAEQGQPDLARTEFEELAQASGSSLAAEARSRLMELPPSRVSRQVQVPLLMPASTATNQP